MSLSFVVRLARAGDSQADESRADESRTDLLVGFEGDADNDQRVKDAVDSIKSLGLKGGRLVTFNGPCSLPVAMALSHAVAHIYGAVAVWDPKLTKYVVSVSHRPDLKVGDLID